MVQVSPRRNKTVLLPLYKIEDLGGIINWTEHLCHGLKANGWNVHLVRLEDTTSCKPKNAYKSTVTKWSGLPYNQDLGWQFPLHHRIPLKVTDWNKYVRKFEFVIWPIPVPPKAQCTTGWDSLYDIKVPQVIIIHDGNLNTRYKHAYRILGKATCVVGVHDCAYNSIRGEGLEKVLIPNPQVLEGRMVTPSMVGREPKVLSLQTFKRWKKVDHLVRAVPHFKNMKVLLGGGGIHMSLMSGKTRENQYGTIWEEAIRSGIHYLGYLSEYQRDKLLLQCKLLVDPSYSKNYAKYGSHFNRAIVDAGIRGCLPAARGLLMKNNSFFDTSEYLRISHKASPKEFAEQCEHVLTLDNTTYLRRVSRLQNTICEYFDSVKVAKQYLDLIK